jgi:hypothetical protein
MNGALISLKAAKSVALTLAYCVRRLRSSSPACGRGRPPKAGG